MNRQQLERQGLSFFKPFKDKGPAWTVNPSIVTDGVSISVEFTKSVIAKRKTKKQKKMKKHAWTINPIRTQLLIMY